MIKNYFKITWRSLLKNKFHTAINITGMVVGFTIGIAVLLAVYSQLSFDNFHENGDRIYQAYNTYYKQTGDESSPQFGYPAMAAYKAESPGIEKASRYMYGGSSFWYAEKELDIPVMMVDEDFLSMFTFRVVKGNKQTPLHSLTDLVITEATAKKIFGNENPIGKSVKWGPSDNLKEMTVSAVVKDFPVNTSIKFDALTRFENRTDFAENKNSWSNQNHPVYVQLKPGTTAQQAEMQIRQVNKKYVPDWYLNLTNEGARADKNGDVFATKLLPLSEVHFSPRIIGSGVNKAEIFVVLLVGLLIILIACFNFININLANAFTRGKEIGVRKCLGAAKGKLFAQLWSESFVVCVISFFISLLLVNVLVYAVNNSFKVNMPLQDLMWQPKFLLSGLGLLLFVSLVAGGYPSWVMMKFKVVETLKGKVSLKRKSVLRNSLIVLQFVIACIMISCTFIIYQQFKHLQHADLGINKDYIISIPLLKPEKTGRDKIEKLRIRLASNPAVVSITGSNINVGKGRDNSGTKNSVGFDYKGKPIGTNMASVDYDYLKTFGLKALEGRDFETSYNADTLLNVLLSESVAKQFAEKNIVGQQLLVDSASPKWNVVGVFPDFHLYSLHESIEPLTLVLDKKAGLNYCFIKTNGKNPVAMMEAIKKEMAELEPGQEFRGSFVDENILNWYMQERVMSVLFSIAACVAIVLSCMGLLAMVLLIIQQRVKEIGVRKVLGASVPHIAAIISKEFLLLVLIAVLIAVPISWLAMNKWLEDFSYRITVQWWMFVLVAVAALVMAMLTISINTIRAAMQNPVKSLRTE
jgi:putative ABC transport system permease protein